MTKESKYAIFKFNKSDEDLVAGLADYLDQHGHIPFDFFEVDVPDEKVVIEIVPTKKEYDENYIKEHNLPADTKLYGWMIGNYIFEKNKITYLSLHDFKNTMHALKDVPFEQAIDYYQKTILHEFVHYANGLFRIKQNCGYSEKYLTEGIAAYLSGQHEGSKVRFDFSCDDLLDRNKNIYYAYNLVTKYFVEHYDKEYVLEVFQSNRQARELLQNELYDRAKEFYTEEQNI